LALLGMLAGSCGFGTGGIVAASRGGGGSANAPATPAGLLVLDAKQSPARIRIVLTDAESDRSTTDFFYVLPGEAGNERRLTQLPANPIDLSTSREGVVHELLWDFAREAGLPPAASFVDGVTVIARVRDGLTQATVVGLGNDAPVVDGIAPPANEVTGIANVAFIVSDTSGDAIDVEVEFFDEAAPQLGWRRARPAGDDAAGTAPAFRGVIAPPAGERLTFFWDTNSRDALGNAVGDLASLERDVRLRFRAMDAVTAPADAVPAESATFHVDNNEQPVLQVNNDALIAGGDRRRTVAVPITVIDAESDVVSVVMQWRRIVETSYPDLGTTDPVLLRQRMQDDAFVREKQICRTRPLTATGTATVLGARSLRTDDLALSQAWALTQGIVGRELEVLRPPAQPPVVASNGWAANPLVRPVAVLAARAGIEALVLDDNAGSAALLVVDLETGATIRQVATGIPGIPTAMCRGNTGGSVLVATHATTGWLIHEVSLVDGSILQRAAGLPPLTNEPIRGLVATANRIALATAGNRVLRIDWTDATALNVRTQIDRLSEPWGIVLDPRDRNRVFVAERSHQSTGRIAAWNLRTGMPTGFLPVASAPVRPSVIAVEPSGSRLLVLGEPLAGGRRLHRYALGVAAGALAPVDVPPDASAVAGDRDGSWVLVAPPSRQVLVQGGVRHRRAVTGYDPATMTLTLDRDIALAPARVSWQIAVGTGRDIVASPTGRREVVLWDTADVAGLGPVALRTFAIDSEFGQASETATGISFLPDEHEDQVLPDTIFGAVDLDGDGDLDLNRGPQFSRQTSPRTFATVVLPPVTGGSTVFDANGDGRNDLFTIFSHFQVSITLQTTNGTFGSSPSQTIGLPVTNILDMNGDGRFDLVDIDGATVAVRYQTPTGTFTSPQTVTSTASVAGIVDIDLVDLTSDGRLDISILLREQQFSSTVFFDARVVVFTQASDGSFPSTPSFDILLDNDYYANLVDYGDIDGDGRTDILLSQPFVPETFIPVIPSHITVLFQGPAGSFVDRFRYDKNGSGFLSTGLGDVDGDGLLDILGDGPGLRQLTPRHFVDLDLPAGGRSLFDIDGDGAADEVSGDTVRFRRGRGRLGSSSQAIPGSLVADFNGDGLFDVGNTSSGFFGGQVQAFLQTPGAAFPTTPDYARGISTGSDSPPFLGLQVGDVSGDGIVDLVSQAISDNGSHVRGEPIVDPTLIQLQTSSFFANTGTGVLSLRDFDGDGRLDVVASIEQGQDISEFRLFRRVDGGFQSPLAGQDLRPAMASSYAWGDLDGDARTDLVVGTSDGRARVYRQDTNGNLVLPPTILGATVSAAAQVDVADLDGDGRPDLLLGSSANGLRVFYGTGSGVPSVGVVLDGSTGQAGVADIDGDGDLDVVLSDGNLLAQWAPRLFLRHPGMFGVDVDFDLDGELDDLGFHTVKFAGR
jgi:hypothetical protein